MIEAITFDFWDTLMVARAEAVDSQRTEALLGIVVGAGFAAERQAMEEALGSARAAHGESWRANQQFGAPDAIDHVLATLEIDASSEVRAELVAAIHAGDPDCGPTPNVIDTLADLKSAGLRIGIICDVGWSPSTLLREHLERHEMLEYFDHWSFSDEVGHYKPAPEAFAHAMNGLGVTDPKAMAHIGDLRRTDIVGARRAGWLSLRYAGVYDDQNDHEEAHHVVRDHADLPELLASA